MAKSSEIKTLPIDQLVGHEDNPNVMSDAQFNKLVENINDAGFVEPVQVAANSDGSYTIIGGHHRVRACMLLNFEELPCVLMADLAQGQKDWEDKRLFHLVRLNLIRGKIDPMKFTEMFNRLSTKYSHEVLKQSFAFWDDKAFQQLYRQIRSGLPPEIQERLDKAKSEIHTIDDIARILNRIFQEHGDTVDFGFIWFSYGGKDHLSIQMEDKLMRKVQKLTNFCKDNELNINDMFAEMMDRHQALYTDSSVVNAK